jgi:hypothetical protein
MRSTSKRIAKDGRDPEREERLWLLADEIEYRLYDSTGAAGRKCLLGNVCSPERWDCTHCRRERVLDVCRLMLSDWRPPLPKPKVRRHERRVRSRIYGKQSRSKRIA